MSLKPTAVAVLQIHDDKVPQLVVLVVAVRFPDGQREILPFIAVDEDAADFLVAPDFDKWANTGAIRRLHTRGLDAEQKASLRRAFIGQQLGALSREFHVLEVATNVAVASSQFPVSEFGKGWGLGWKMRARLAAGRFRLESNTAFEFLLEQNKNVNAAYRGALHVAVKYGLDQLTQDERESAGTDTILDGAGAKPYNGGRF